MSCCGGSKSKTDKWSTFPDAAYNGNREKMEELIKTSEARKDLKAYIDKRDAQDFTALHRAAQKGQCDAIKWLIEKGADTEAVTKDGESVLHIAAFHRKSDAVVLLLSNANSNAKKLINHQDTKHGMTPLHHAVYRGCKDIAYTLKQHGADGNIPDKLGETAFQMAEFWAEQEKQGMSSPQAQHRQTLEVLTGK